MSIPLLFAIAYPFCLAWAATTDILSMTIPNRLTAGLALAFLPVGIMLHLSLAQWGVHFGLGLAGLAVGILFFALRFMGGGDAKLIAAAGLWLGGEGCMAFLVYTALAGGALTLGLLAARKYGAVYAGLLPPSLSRHLEPAGDIPYGVAICVGGLLAIPHADILNLLV